MNKQLLFIALLAFSAVNAQTKMTDKEAAKHMKAVQKSKDKGDVLWDWDTVYNSGVPYCIVYEVEKGAFTHNEYSVRSLTGKELIYVKYDTYVDPTIPHDPGTPPMQVGYYTYIFIDTKNTGEVQLGKVYKEVVKDNLIANGTSVDANAESQFIAVNGKKFSQRNPPPPSDAMVVSSGMTYSMVERNRNAGILVLGTDINQDGKSIGRIESKETATDGTIVKNIDVFTPNGLKVAMASCQGATSHNWTLVTLKNNMQNTINSSVGQDNMDIVKFLIYGNYL
ncbi:MAG TPA: hypothetical protein VNZ45_09205 [Bacteroidia bacterium]|jgi:hypothetical protein|nr:hypothetical protein [Bacteroidia bacterium]